MYIMARGIIGFGLPYAIVAGSCLIGELAYPKERPILTSLFNACYFLGAIVAAGSTFGTQHIANDWSWRIPSLLQMAPSLLQILFVFFLPESPRFLMSKDRYEDAKEILIKYHAEGNPESEFVKAEIIEIKTTLEIELENSKRSWGDLIRTAGMRRRVVIGSLLGLFTQLSGNVVISYYLGDVLKLIGYTDPSFQAQYNLGNQCWSLVCGVSAALVVMRFRRRTMYLTGILSIFAVYVAWTVCTAVFVSTHSEVAAKLSLFWIYAYSPAYNLCFNALTYSEWFSFMGGGKGDGGIFADIVNSVPDRDLSVCSACERDRHLPVLGKGGAVLWDLCQSYWYVFWSVGLGDIETDGINKILQQAPKPLAGSGSSSTAAGSWSRPSSSGSSGPRHLAALWRNWLSVRARSSLSLSLGVILLTSVLSSVRKGRVCPSYRCRTPKDPCRFRRGGKDRPWGRAGRKGLIGLVAWHVLWMEIHVMNYQWDG